jgi:hypothetical protein
MNTREETEQGIADYRHGTLVTTKARMVEQADSPHHPG